MKAYETFEGRNSRVKPRRELRQEKLIPIAIAIAIAIRFKSLFLLLNNKFIFIIIAQPLRGKCNFHA